MIPGKHTMKVTIDNYNGLAAEPICVDHDADNCGAREAFFWDPAASMENYQGREIVLGDFPIEITEISEDGWYWQTSAEGTGQPANQTATGSPSGGPELLEGT